MAYARSSRHYEADGFTVFIDRILRADWSPIGLEIRIKKQTASNWPDGGLEVGRAHSWDLPIGCDMEAEEAKVIAAAWVEVDRLRQALCGKG